MSLPRRVILIVALASVAAIAGSTRADAHAILERSDPPAYRLLLRPPDRITLQFSEPIDAPRSHVRVLDQEGRRVDRQDLQISGDRRQVGLGIRVPGPGIYTVAWRTFSLIDQHAYEGFFTITVGPLRAGSFTLQTGTSAEPTPWDVAVRWMMFIGMAVLGGGYLVHRFLLPPALGAATVDPRWADSLYRRWRVIAVIAAAIFVAGMIGEALFLATRAAQAARESVAAALVLLAAAEPMRTSLLLRIIMTALLLALLWRR
ncbi:MAG: copper resistance CopC family protein, partial [bacterium]